jgi:hypothetical protein
MDVLMDASRRRFLKTAGMGAAGLGIAAAQMKLISAAGADIRETGGSKFVLTPIKQIRAGVLDVGYYEAGPSNGRVVLLLHGWPYDIHSYVDVAPILRAHRLQPGSRSRLHQQTCPARSGPRAGGRSGRSEGSGGGIPGMGTGYW